MSAPAQSLQDPSRGGPSHATTSHRGLVLSLFPGIGLLDRGFELEGWCVVRGPDLIFGGDVCDFSPTAGHFAGVIGGPPCQDFSRARRGIPKTGKGVKMLREFLRVVDAARPEWFLLENVPCVPDVALAPYHVQRLDFDARECGLAQARLRHFQFGSLDGSRLSPERGPVTATGESQPTCMASEGRRTGRRDWETFCKLQGLPMALKLPSFTVAARYEAVGNGVPLPMARAMARAIARRVAPGTVTLCGCGCGRSLRSGQSLATVACRQRASRARRFSRQAVTL
jgi:DNA (cytosine-5)-methyltransferase 1